MTTANTKLSVASSGPGTRFDAPDRFLRILEDPWFARLVRLQDHLTRATSAYWAQQGLLSLHLPITTGSISSPMGLGSNSSPVCVELFGVPTYLADSMQFALEYGCRLSPSGCYYVMPSFRGEQPDDTHLCQFFHSEAEVPGGLDDVIDVATGYLKALCRSLLDEMVADLESAVGDLAHVEALVASEFRRLTFDEAARILEDRPEWVTRDPDGWRTLTRAGEQRLMSVVGEFTWVTHWDHAAVPFYQAFADDEGRSALNGDLLFGPGEVVGLGERHPDGERVRIALDRHDVSAADYDWYCRMKDQHPLRTSGFGMGVERFFMWVLKHDDIRDLQVLPRRNGEMTLP